MKNIFTIIIIIILVFCFFYSNIVKNKYEKYFLIGCAILQLAVLYGIKFNNNKLLLILSKIYVLSILIGIILIKDYVINYFIILLITVTLLTRIFYSKCLFYIYYKDSKNYNNNNIFNYINLFYLIILFIYIFKIL